MDRHQRHRVVAENVDDLHCDGVASGLRVCVGRAHEFEVAVLAGAEAFPFVLEDVAAGPAFLERRDNQFTLRRCEAR